MVGVEAPPLTPPPIRPAVAAAAAAPSASSLILRCPRRRASLPSRVTSGASEEGKETRSASGERGEMGIVLRRGATSEKSDFAVQNSSFCFSSFTFVDSRASVAVHCSFDKTESVLSNVSLRCPPLRRSHLSSGGCSS